MESRCYVRMKLFLVLLLTWCGGRLCWHSTHPPWKSGALPTHRKKRVLDLHIFQTKKWLFMSIFTFWYYHFNIDLGHSHVSPPYFKHNFSWIPVPSQDNQLREEVCFHYRVAGGGSTNSLPKPACPHDWAECRCAGSSICKLFTCKWFLSFISRDYFPVLEEGIVAKNTALNHVSSILVPLGFCHLSVFVPAHAASHLRSPGTASEQARSAGRYLHLAIASFPLKTLRPNG